MVTSVASGEAYSFTGGEAEVVDVQLVGSGTGGWIGTLAIIIGGVIVIDEVLDDDDDPVSASPG